MILTKQAYELMDKDRILYLLYEVGLSKTQALAYHFTVDKGMGLTDAMRYCGVSIQAGNDFRANARKTISEYGEKFISYSDWKMTHTSLGCGSTCNSGDCSCRC